MNTISILQILSGMVELPDLDPHNFVNTAGVLFLIWYAQRLIKRVDVIDKHLHQIDIAIARIQKELEIRNEK